MRINPSNARKIKKNLKFAIIFHFFPCPCIYRHTKKKWHQIARINKTISFFLILGYSVAICFLLFLCHKYPNRSKMEKYRKFWIFVDFARILMGLWTKLIFWYFWSFLWVNRQIVVKLWQHGEIQIRRLGYVSFNVYMVCSSLKFVTFPFHFFWHFWVLPNWKYCMQSRKLVGKRQTVINFHEKNEFNVLPDK